MSTEACIEMSFRDRRPPNEIQAHFERTLMTLFKPEHEGSKLVFKGAARITGCQYRFALRFDGARLTTNCYTIRIDASWANLQVQHYDYFRRTSESWFAFWTKPFKPSAMPEEGDCLAGRYKSIEDHALTAESHLMDVASIQQAILSEMRKGAYYSTVHKEGGTNIRWQGSHFLRADFGESSETESFFTDAAFLHFLRKFYDRETSATVFPNKVSDFEAWKLIWRLLQHQ
jgi:hypothetical protein